MTKLFSFCLDSLILATSIFLVAKAVLMLAQASTVRIANKKALGTSIRKYSRNEIKFTTVE